jgi:tRNA (guanine37-N1)-methyltransferase
MARLSFDVITIFPNLFSSYLSESLIARAQAKKLIKINIHNLRKWTSDVHKTVDDRPFGGGLGMVLKIEPIYKALRALKSKIQNPKSKTILFTPRGKKFNQQIAYKLSKLNQIIMICGRYEGVDERVAKQLADMELSIGDYDLMGGELPAMVVVETVARLVPGVVGKEEFLKERMVKGGPALNDERKRGVEGFIEYPQYTRPESFEIAGKKRGAPKVLVSGDHKRIEAWRKKHGKLIK